MALDIAATDQVGAHTGAIVGPICVDVDQPPLSLNALVSEHFRSRAHRRAKERAAVAKALDGKRLPPGPPWTVTLTRIASREFDDDNLQAAFKAFRDEVAAVLGVNDGDRAAVVWRYRQLVQRVATPAGPHGMKDPKKPAFKVWARIEIATWAP